jgi:hypothetical protein
MYFFARRRHSAALPPSRSDKLQAQQDADLRAEDLKPSQLRKLKEELDLWNATGRIVTFDITLKDWADWNRYVFSVWQRNNSR